MTTRSDKTYQDPRLTGSLSNLLQLWRKLPSAKRNSAATHVTFTLSCGGESRATRVAGFLRRRRDCAETWIHKVGEGRRGTWEVQGSIYPAVHSLADLEATWTWLRRAAQSHQVDLLRIGLVTS